MTKQWDERADHMRLHANLAAAHLKEIIYSFEASDDDGLFEEADSVIESVLKWIEKEGPWL